MYHELIDSILKEKGHIFYPQHLSELLTAMPHLLWSLHVRKLRSSLAE